LPTPASPCCLSTTGSRANTPHPTPVEDAYAGLLWLATHTAELGIDPNRIAVMGDSAGAGIAAALTILSRDRAGPPLAHQILLYPMLDDRNTTPDPEIAPFAGWTYDDNITAWNALLGPAVRRRGRGSRSMSATEQRIRRRSAGALRRQDRLTKRASCGWDRRKWTNVARPGDTGSYRSFDHVDVLEAAAWASFCHGASMATA
jgi:acetyl esterase/lipase